MRLPTKHKVLLLLHYVEGYKVDEIAKILTITTMFSSVNRSNNNMQNVFNAKVFIQIGIK